ncbi:GNAT family N-acetyltransferase [Streptomyces hyaluromycini]|uniref:GNAT family N-acetyltransferase n=1 Tax=Streptomyces hyaluromycini TaxID=1377993 RepID=UPI000B5C209D|nr:GNAT family protein [Streptomyces hyaluromycini]
MAWDFLEGRKCNLRSLMSEDADSVVAIMADPQVMEPYGQPVRNREEIISYLREAEKEAAESPRLHYKWAVVRKDTSVVIGVWTLDLAGAGTSSAMFGAFFGGRHQGKGAATDAARAVFRFAFEELGLHRLWACHNDTNPVSGFAMRYYGMTYEGCRREVSFADGRWVNSLHYSLLEHEWRQLEAPTTG